MRKFTKYVSATGEIEYTFTGTVQDAELNGPCIEGWYPADEYTIVDGVPVYRGDEFVEATKLAEAWEEFRRRRDGYLQACDWVTGRAYELKEEVPLVWIEYRTALRNLPETITDPRSVIWPTPPNNGRY